MATPRSTAGMRLQINVSGTFTNIPKAESWNLATAGKPEIDTTGLEDTAKDFVDGIPDNGQCTGSIMFDPGDAAHMKLWTSSATANAAENFKLIFPFAGTNNTISFNGRVMNMGIDAAKDSAIKAPVTIKVTSAFAWS